jgi:hypothetical protein
LQAALQGISLDQANRASALQEQAYVQDRPLNLVNALRSGAQVQSPQFQSYYNQGQTGGADYSGAANQQYSADISNYNAQSAASPMNGLFSLGGTVLGLGTGNGATVGGGLFNAGMKKMGWGG